MNIRNLEVVDSEGVQDHILLVERLNELERFIYKNYRILNKETAIEFNIGSKIVPYSMHLVVYNNPKRVNNPYVFISARLNDERILVNKAELVFFAGLMEEKG